MPTALSVGGKMVVPGRDVNSRQSMAGPYRIEQLCRENLDDFRTLLVTPPHSWCWCVAWETPTWEGWTDRTEEANHSLREALWLKGEFHGYLLYCKEAPAGWCRVGPRRTWPKLCEHFGLEPDEDVYSFTCFGMRGELQGRGLSHVLVAGVLEDLARRNVSLIESFPKKIEGRVESGKVWMGPVSVFERAGFEKVQELKNNWHMQRKVNP